MYDIFEKLLKEKGVKTSDVCKATGLKAPTFSDWKKGKSSPNADKLILIAEYFGVSVPYLRTGKEPKLSVSNTEIDTDLVFLDRKIKEYALKMSKLSDEKLDAIFTLIDAYERKER